MTVLNAVASLAWISVTVWFMPAIIRIAHSRAQRCDPLQAAISFLYFNLFWFSARPWVFGQRYEAMTPAEMVWRVGTLGFGLVSSFLVVRVVYFYKRQG